MNTYSNTQLLGLFASLGKCSLIPSSARYTEFFLFLLLQAPALYLIQSSQSSSCPFVLSHTTAQISPVLPQGPLSSIPILPPRSGTSPNTAAFCNQPVSLLSQALPVWPPGHLHILGVIPWWFVSMWCLATIIAHPPCSLQAPVSFWTGQYQPWLRLAVRPSGLHRIGMFLSVS